MKRSIYDILTINDVDWPSDGDENCMHATDKYYKTSTQNK